jgi:hypothetical protein
MSPLTGASLRPGDNRSPPWSLRGAWSRRWKSPAANPINSRIARKAAANPARYSTPGLALTQLRVRGRSRPASPGPSSVLPPVRFDRRGDRLDRARLLLADGGHDLIRRLPRRLLLAGLVRLPAAEAAVASLRSAVRAADSQGAIFFCFFCGWALTCPLIREVVKPLGPPHRLI